MTVATVIGLPRSSAISVAQSLAAVLRAPLHVDSNTPAPDEAVALVTSAAAIDHATPILVFTDDAPLERGRRPEAATAVLAAVARAVGLGTAVAILRDARATKRWLAKVEEDGLPVAARPLARVFLATDSSSQSREIADRLATGLALPLLEPDPPGHEPAPEGWGPRYQAAAAQKSWVIRSSSWHAVEALSARADLVIHPQLANEFLADEDAPKPSAKRWRLLFAPWWRRYPRTEASLLSRELAAHAHEAPLFTVLTEQELELVLTGLLARTAVSTA